MDLASFDRRRHLPRVAQATTNRLGAFPFSLPQPLFACSSVSLERSPILPSVDRRVSLRSDTLRKHPKTVNSKSVRSFAQHGIPWAHFPDHCFGCSACLLLSPLMKPSRMFKENVLVVGFFLLSVAVVALLVVGAIRGRTSHRPAPVGDQPAK